MNKNAELMAIGVASQKWYVNGAPTDSTGTTFTVKNYPVGTYMISARVVGLDNIVYYSNEVILTVVNDVTAYIVGPEHACQQDVVTLTAVATTTETMVEYQWRRDGQPIPGATSPSYSFSVSDLPGLIDTLVYEFDCKIIYAGCADRYTPVHYFSVSPTPVTYLNAPLFCENNPVTLTAESFTAGSEQPYKWKWYNGSTLLDSTFVNTYTIANPTSGDKIAVVPVYLDFACNATTDTVELISYEDSIGTPSALTLTVDTNKLCLGQSATFTVTDPNTDAKWGTRTYAWSVNGAPVAGITDSILTKTFDAVGNFTVKVTAFYSSFPCGVVVADTSVNVEDAPTNVYIEGQSVVCNNDTTILIAHATGAKEYSWDGGATFSTDSSHKAVPGNTYYVIAKSENGCQSVAGPFTVSSIGTDLQITASAMNVCVGEHVTLNADLQGAVDSNVVYTWTPGGNGSTIDVVPASGENKYVVEASFGSCSHTDTIIINGNALPSAPSTVTAVPTAVCVGGQSVITATATGAASYIWYVDGIEVPGMNLSTINVNFDEVGTHSVTARAVDSNGCVSPVASAAATVNAKAAPTSLAVFGETVLCNRDSSIFIAHADSATKYSWDGGAFSSDSSFKASVGTHYVVAQNAAGCTTEPVTFTVSSIGTNLQITPSTMTACNGVAVTLNANLMGAIDSNVVYTWYNATSGSNIASEQGVQSAKADAKLSDLHTARLKWR